MCPNYRYIFNKALQMWGLIWRHCKDMSSHALKVLYCSLVRSVLEYASSVWHPTCDTHISLLERVQKKFLRSIEFKEHHLHQQGEYEWVMSFLNIKSLEIRRDITDLCVLHAIINNHIDSNDLLAKLMFRVPNKNCRTTRSCKIFRINKASTNMSTNHPLRRMMKQANELSNFVKFDIFNSNLVVFKRMINNLV